MQAEELESLARIRGEGLAVSLTMTIRLHANGAMSVEGPTGDKAFCRKLLDEAWKAIERQPAPGKLVIPGKDVDSRSRESYL